MNEAKEWQIGEWLDSKPDQYDLGAAYDREVAPLVDALLEKCRGLDIPVVVVCSPAYSGKGPETSMSCYLGDTVERCSGVVMAAAEAARGDFDKGRELYQLAIHRHQNHE